MGMSHYKKRTLLDLIIIFLITCIPLTLVMMMGQKEVLNVVKDMPLLIKTFYIAFIQFSIAGLGVVLVMLLRKEKFQEYGLRREGILKSSLMGSTLIALFILMAYLEKGHIQFLPFRQVNVTQSLLDAGLLVAILGMALVALAWGFFEGFNYVYISRKINALWQVKNPFLRPGPIIMGISCIFVHGAVGQDMLAILSSFFIIYLLLMIVELTNNAWGCIWIFMFYWNAI